MVFLLCTTVMALGLPSFRLPVGLEVWATYALLQAPCAWVKDYS